MLPLVCSLQLILFASENLPGASGSAFLEIMAMRIGKPGALFLWVRIYIIQQKTVPKN